MPPGASAVRSAIFNSTNASYPAYRSVFRQQWSAYRPVGTLNARFEVEVSPHRWSPTVEIECRDVSLRWQRFSYPLRHATGRVTIRPDRLSFQLRATAADQPVRLRGEINHPGEDWTGWCEGVSEGPLPIDESLIAATPPVGAARHPRLRSPRLAELRSPLSASRSARTGANADVDQRRGWLCPASFLSVSAAPRQCHAWNASTTIGVSTT